MFCLPLHWQSACSFVFTDIPSARGSVPLSDVDICNIFRPLSVLQQSRCVPPVRQCWKYPVKKKKEKKRKYESRCVHNSRDSFVRFCSLNVCEASDSYKCCLPVSPYRRRALTLMARPPKKSRWYPKRTWLSLAASATGWEKMSWPSMFPLVRLFATV